MRYEMLRGTCCYDQNDTRQAPFCQALVGPVSEFSGFSVDLPVHRDIRMAQHEHSRYAIVAIWRYVAVSIMKLGGAEWIQDGVVSIKE